VPYSFHEQVGCAVDVERRSYADEDSGSMSAAESFLTFPTSEPTGEAIILSARY
jgi:hypothetical protein